MVDSSLYNQKDLDKVSKLSYATIVVAAERIEDMPIIRKIGDIIRIQNASMKVRDGQKQFVVDERSNWCLFSPTSSSSEDKAKTPLVNLDDMDLEDGQEVDDTNFK